MHRAGYLPDLYCISCRTIIFFQIGFSLSSMEEFYDFVVLTAIDGGQKELFELQIKDLLLRQAIPVSCQYRVVQDYPSDAKIGKLHYCKRSLETNLVQFC